MNVKLKVGTMEVMYTARDTNDRDLQDRMTTLLPWLAEVMAACEANYHARQQAAQQAAAQPTSLALAAPAPRAHPGSARRGDIPGHDASPDCGQPQRRWAGGQRPTHPTSPASV